MGDTSPKAGRKLREILDNRRIFTQKISDICRQLGYASIAICWVFNNKVAEPNDIILPTTLLISLICTIIFFILDIWQYASGETIYKDIAKNCQESLKGEFLDEYCPITDEPNKKLYLLFRIKIYFLIASFITLAIYYFSHFKFMQNIFGGHL